MGWHLVLFGVLFWVVPGGSWREWTNFGNTSTAWQAVWGLSDGPGGRQGHTLVLELDNRVVLFGGRADEVQRLHIPKTYEISRVDGTLEFISYDQKPVLDCQANALQANTTNSTDTCSLYVTSGLYFNDVWVYDLNCTRTEDGPCEKSGWASLHPGARNGGCHYYRGREVCPLPSERYNHGAAMFDDRTMIIYGGFGQRCGDYCDDVWSFDLRDSTWMEIYSLGYLSTSISGPGKRWKFSLAFDGAKMLVFGGYRLWHGFATNNSQANLWNNTDQYPAGGYLSDLWVYTKRQLATGEQVPTEGHSPAYGNWTQLEPVEVWAADVGEAWSERDAQSCSIDWPKARAGHVALWDGDLNGMWVHGGYTTYFPYVSTDGAGSDIGVTSLGDSSGFRPYPDYPFYLDDLWFFNYSSGIWKQITYQSTTNPAPRMDHVMIKAGAILVMHGGYHNNHHYDDTWQLNTTSSRWLEKTTFVHAIYAQNCTDDLVFIGQNNCTNLLWPKYLEREDNYPWGILPYSDQDYYYPDAQRGPYYGITFKGGLAAEKAEFPDKTEAPVGTPMFPFAATAPRQFAQSFFYQYNATYNATLYEWCTSVQGEPTRGTLLDGLAGRSNHSILIPQPRRQAPGWDGCRDRADGDTSLPWTLMWEHPGHRSNAKAVFSTYHNSMLMFGGLGYNGLYMPSVNFTRNTVVLDELWQLGLDNCPNGCNTHGDCSYGFCYCHSGYYGLDCSNTSCPGDFCYYDDITQEQICKHCCQAGYTHTDNDTYQPDLFKQSCSLDPLHLGQSHGICDGFGTCQCSPPFIGEDCSIRDCPSNCSFNGWCSVEYPVSRCICNPGYYGGYCQYQECLNNCSYPNGLCNSTTGECACWMMYNPYNNTRPYYPWAGEDCSYLVAFAGATHLHWSDALCSLVVVASLFAGIKSIHW